MVAADVAAPGTAPAAAAAPRETPLAALHRSLGGRMVPFAGYAMPVQYPSGILAEHAACRAFSALFDVSHMGQAVLRGPGAARALEAITPADLAGLKPGRQRYGLLTTESGGILDDFMVASLSADGDRLFLVLNASRKALDEAAIGAVLPPGVTLTPLRDRALLALQGPEAEAALAPLAPGAVGLPFMGVAETAVAGAPAIVSRSGYTGEDGFEISLPAGEAERVARALLDRPGVVAAGLGARDSLRLEAGLCLYGQDLDEGTSPVEAALTWTIGKRRRLAWDFAGAERVRAELEDGPSRLRVGFAVEGRQPVRSGNAVAAGARDDDAEDEAAGPGAGGGEVIGVVTSGGPSPTLGANVAVGYVARAHAADGTPVSFALRGRAVRGRVAPTPFVPHRYKRAVAPAAATA